MNRKHSFLSVLTAFLGMSLAACAQNTPDWLRFLGDGSAGGYSCTSGTCVLGDERWVSSFNVSAGATVVSSANNGPFIIRSTGACNIAGTISNSVNTAGGGGILNSGDFGAGGGGGGGGKVAGHVGLSTVGDGGIPIINGGLPGAAAQNGGNGGSPRASQYHSLISNGTFWAVGGSTGGQGGGNGGGVAGGRGGNGGGPVILVCNSISFIGAIDASGAQGSPAQADNTGAGGGGGGGYVILSAITWNANSGTILTRGGAGGSCNSHVGCGAGGSGGNGWSFTITIK